MHITAFHGSRRRRGSVLLLVLVLAAASLLVLSGVLSWTKTSTDMAGRHAQYFRTLAATEAASEKIVARIGNDYQNYGVPLVLANLETYRTIVPTTQDSTYWSNYQFMDENGVLNQITVDFLPVTDSSILSSRYRGLRGFAYDVRVLAKAREVNAPFQIVTRIRQNLELSMVVVFQYAVFYNVDLEINPSPPMVITGPVHCNANVYLSPATTLTFEDDLTAAGTINLRRKPGDPSGAGGGGTVTFMEKHAAGSLSLNLPIGNTNSTAAVRQIIEIPPWSESPTSPQGSQRYYNQADLVILVSDSGITATSGSVNGFGTSVPTNQAAFFLNTAATFYNAREGKMIKCTDFDVAKFRLWNETNVVLRPLLVQQDVRTIFIADNRTQSGTEPGIRLINGQWLPPKGLTVATPYPIYIKGHYNVTTNGTPVNLGTADTSASLPASVAADAVTILSANWNDANASSSSSALSSRIATSTTVNCAVLAGNVPTSGGSYSGGLENFPRFLEDWSGQTFTYNGSLVAMYDSRIATAPWGGGGVYSPPIRNWSFDPNFNDITKVPPASPQVRLLLRGGWSD